MDGNPNYTRNEGYIDGRRDWWIIDGRTIDEGKWHIDPLPLIFIPHSLYAWKCYDSWSNDGVRSIVKIAGILDTATQAEKDPFSRNAFLVGQSSSVIATDIRSISNIAFAFKPEGYQSSHLAQPIAKYIQLIKTLLWWKPIKGPTREELHSPEDTPVLGAIMLLTILALQLVSVCSQSKLSLQLEPDSNRHPHCKIELWTLPFHTLFHEQVICWREYVLGTGRRTAENCTVLNGTAEKMGLMTDEHRLQEGAILYEGIWSNEVFIPPNTLSTGQSFVLLATNSDEGRMV